jgi:ABC-2 type transport system permease protein
VNELAGTGALVRLIVRRDRLLLPAWIGLAALLAFASAASFARLYPTADALRAYAAETAGNPAVVALLGPVFAPTVGGLVAWRWTMQGLAVVGVASLLTMIRHTRGDEEAGRREVLGSAVVGRLAPLAAALLVTGAADLLAGAVVAAGLIGLGLPAAGSIALGLSVAAAGCTVAAIAGVAAQATRGAGAARGIAGGVFVLLYVLRAVGDVSAIDGGPAWPGWLSPVGWTRSVRPFAGEQWWVFGLFGVAVAALCVVAFVLCGRRDLGQELLPEAAGPARAAPYLSSPVALAWRLQRGLLVAWTAAFAVLGVAFGYVVRTVADLLSLNTGLLAFFTGIGGGAPPGDVVFHLYFLTFGPLVAVYAMLATLRVRSEEVTMRADPVLAAGVTRVQFMGSHLLLATLGPLVILGVLGASAGFIYGATGGDVGHQLPRVLAGALVYLPAVWVMVGIAALQLGLAPGRAFIPWVAWLGFGVVDFVHERRLAADWLAGISPFAHVPRVLLGDQLQVAPLVGLLAVAALLVVLGVRAFQTRDLGG